jgi:uncharacterized paraquat-inducible protein A
VSGAAGYDGSVLASGNSAVMNGVLLASAVVPVLIVVVLAWLFLRAGRRHDQREAARAQTVRPPLPPEAGG